MTLCHYHDIQCYIYFFFTNVLYARKGVLTSYLNNVLPNGIIGFIEEEKTLNIYCYNKLSCFLFYFSFSNIKTSRLRRLQEQTHPDEAPQMGKIHPFSKIAITVEPVMQFGCPSGFRISLKIVT